MLVARSGSKRSGKKSPQFFQCITAIVKQLVDDHEKGTTSNVSKIKADYSTKYSLIDSPKTVEIISAIPEEYRDAIVPILKTKPVRTASGTIAVAVMCTPHRCPHQGLHFFTFNVSKRKINVMLMNVGDFLIYFTSLIYENKTFYQQQKPESIVFTVLVVSTLTSSTAHIQKQLSIDFILFRV